jgi:predicted unusual protein kinase regulating ubiquinone biosynthesis (AarF/ABC1/UbiB family)
MGGVMIKVGQFLSSRLDVLPAEITETLADLQDEVPAEDFADIRSLAESELGAVLGEKYDWFDPEPLAAASLGQVHRARLKPGSGEVFRNVVVKVQRPSISSIVEVDLSALQRVGNWLMKYKPIREHADVPELMREFGETIRDEINYLKEADNARVFFSNFKKDKKVRVPRVVTSLTTLKVLTLEDVYAIKITDYEEISRVGIDRSEVARKLLDTYLVQIFEDGFFHADPHPGNLFVTPIPSGEGAREKQTRWKLTFVDFGMVGHVPENLRTSLRETLIAIGTRDAARLIKSYQSLGFILPGADTIMLEKASEAVFDRFWGMSMSDLRNISPGDIHDMGHRVRDIMVDMPFQVPNDLLMLVRALAILSGMCTGLAPDFNFWKQLEPYARKLVAEETANSFSVDKILVQVGDLLQTIITLPAQASRLLAKIETGKLVVQSPSMDNEMRHIRSSLDTLILSVIFSALLLGGIQLINTGEYLTGGYILFITGIFMLLIVVGRLLFGRK